MDLLGLIMEKIDAISDAKSALDQIVSFFIVLNRILFRFIFLLDFGFNNAVRLNPMQKLNRKTCIFLGLRNDFMIGCLFSYVEGNTIFCVFRVGCLMK